MGIEAHIISSILTDVYFFVSALLSRQAGTYLTRYVCRYVGRSEQKNLLTRCSFRAARFWARD